MAGGAELDSLRDLLDHFGEEGWEPPRAEEAFDIIADRYRGLADQYVEVAEVVSEVVDASQISLPTACRRVLLIVHRQMYEGILNNAGSPRQLGDSGGSTVYFGGMQGNRRIPKFEGSPADQIAEELERASQKLQDRRGGDLEKARDEAILFYAELSRIHPFYDGNGRAGRFAISVYLHLHGWLVEWGEVEKHEGKFMKKINSLNKRRGQGVESTYQGYLLSFWARHVVRTEDLE